MSRRVQSIGLLSGAWLTFGVLLGLNAMIAPPRHFGQGMISRGAAAMPRPESSGRDFRVEFVDTAAAAGLTAPQICGGARKKYIVESIGTGVAFFDYDNDDWPDIFLVNGSRFDPAPGSPPTNHLYRNNGNGTFRDVTEQAGLSRTGWGQSVSVGDYDNDGFADLFVTYWGLNALYRNNGNGTFSDVSPRAGVAGERRRWGSGASFVDYDRDGYLDLFVANYLDLDTRRTPLPGQDPNCQWLGIPVICGPRGLPFSHNSLYRNNRDGTFTDVSLQSGIGQPLKTYALGVIAADMDGDGWQDVYVASDSTRSLLYQNNGDGTFREKAIYMGLAYDDNGREQAGMGVALADYDGDGLLDIVKTNFADDYPNLYHNLGKAGYTDRALRAGLGVNPQYVLWSPIMEDFDNDAKPDLFITAGHFFPEVDQLKIEQRFRNPRLLYRNLGSGRFEDVAGRAGPGILANHSSRGAAAGDYDNDGNLDLLVMNMNEPPSLLRNRGSSGNNWIKVKLEGTKSNRMAIGARVRVVAGGTTQTMVALSQSGFYSSGERRLHFGLERAPKVDSVEILWPSGVTDTWRDLKPNRTFLATEGASERQP